VIIRVTFLTLCGQARRRTDVLEHAFGTFRTLRIADSAPVENHPQAERASFGGRQKAVQFELQLDRVVQHAEPERLLSRPTWVSTGRPGRSKATLRTTLPVLRPTPGRVTRSSSSCRDLAVEAVEQRLGHPDEALRLVLIEAGRADDLFDVDGFAAASSTAVGYGGTRSASPC
jgi:hypothetical protein